MPLISYPAFSSECETLLVLVAQTEEPWRRGRGYCSVNARKGGQWSSSSVLRGYVPARIFEHRILNEFWRQVLPHKSLPGDIVVEERKSLNLSLHGNSYHTASSRIRTGHLKIASLRLTIVDWINIAYPEAGESSHCSWYAFKLFPVLKDRPQE